MHCEERIRELEQQLRDLENAWDAEVKRWEERVRDLEDDCRNLEEERDEWYDEAAEWRQRAEDREYERDTALEQRNEALNRVHTLEEELGRIRPQYDALRTILQEELEHLETLVKHADWEHAVEQIAHIRKRYHAAIAIHTLQNPNTT